MHTCTYLFTFIGTCTHTCSTGQLSEEQVLHTGLFLWRGLCALYGFVWNYIEHYTHPFVFVVRCTPLHHACRLGNADIASELIQHGCSLDCVDKLGYTPLHTAVSRDQHLVAQLLIQAGCDGLVVCVCVYVCVRVCVCVLRGSLFLFCFVVFYIYTDSSNINQCKCVC